MSSDAWETGIAEVRPDDVVVRGYPLSELVGRITYTDSVFLVITGELPAPGQRRLLDAVFVTLVEHGISPSSIIVRTLASCGTPVQAALAGGVLSIADWHGGSCEQVAQRLAEISSACAELPPDERPAAMRRSTHECLVAAKTARQRVDGFGHPQHPDGDPRAHQLLDLADEFDVTGVHIGLVRLFEEELAAVFGRRIGLNVTGAVAAVLLDLGFPWQAARGLIISARSAGLVAHAVEELRQGGRWRHAPAERVRYTGSSERHLVNEP